MTQLGVSDIDGRRVTRHETLADLVTEFQITPPDCAADDAFYSSLDLPEAIRSAALAVTAKNSAGPSPKRPALSEKKQRASLALTAVIEAIQECRDFDELLALVTKTLRGIDGLRDLYYYDTSRRIGAFLGLFPKRVYLHRGATDGARALGLNHTKVYLNMVSLPIELRRLEPRHVEEFLGRYKERLKKLA